MIAPTTTTNTTANPRPREATTFTPTPAQRALLAAFAAIGHTPDHDDNATTNGNGKSKPAPRATIERICERAGVAVERFTQWLTDDDDGGFRAWWEQATEAALRSRASLVLRALTERAEAGDLAAIRLWLPRFDRLERDAGADDDRTAWTQLLADIIRDTTSDDANAFAADDRATVRTLLRGPDTD